LWTFYDQRNLALNSVATAQQLVYQPHRRHSLSANWLLSGLVAAGQLAQWHYHLLPQALGCDGWFTARVDTCGELDAAMSKAESCGTGAYIEVVTDKFVAPPMAMKLHESVEALYQA